jgi:acetylornithine deacetylase/succinyl-diaminopimelate desuccinylase-like protein
MLCRAIASLKDADGRITIPGFYDDVVEPSQAELDAWRKLKDEATLKELMGVRALEGEPEFSPVERTWARPTLDVHGVVGGFIDEGSKTVIPARAKAKVSMRLVPRQDPKRILAALRAYASELATPGVEISVHELGASPPVLCDIDHAGIAAATVAFEKAFGVAPVLVREGGSVPVTIDFQEAFDPKMILTGFGLPDDALHSPNEKMDLEQFHRGTEMVIHLLDELARRG